ncbi:hypothetical protein Gotri_021043, partial [Gossypium trilobum]|nr:hypothetical protein [Gossypium trilobum]
MKTHRLLRSRSTAWALGIILIVRPGVWWISLVRFQWPSITLLLLVVAVDPLQRPDCKATLAPRWVFISMARLQRFRQFRRLMGVTEMKWLWKWEVLKTLLTKNGAPSSNNTLGLSPMGFSESISASSKVNFDSEMLNKSVEKNEGVNLPGQNFIRAFWEYNAEHKPDIVCLIEPKVSGKKTNVIIEKLGFNYSHQVEAVGFSGGIW